MMTIAKHVDRSERAKFHRHDDLIRKGRLFEQAEIRFIVPIPRKKEWLLRTV